AGTRRVGIPPEPVRDGDRTGRCAPEVAGRVVAGEPGVTTRRRRTSGQSGRAAARGLPRWLVRGPTDRTVGAGCHKLAAPPSGGLPRSTAALLLRSRR